MADREKTVKLLDRIIEVSLYILVFFLPISRAVIEICASIAIICWIAKRILLPEERIWGLFPSTYLNLPILFYVLICVVSILTSTYPYLSLRFFIGKTLEYVLLFFIVVDTIITKKRLRNIMIIIFASSFLIAIDGIWQHFSHYEFLRHRSWDYGMRRITGPFNSPNDLGSYLALVLPVAICFLYSNLKNWRKKMPNILLVILLAIAFIFSLSRGAWLAFILSLFFIGILIRKRILILFMVLILLILPFIFSYLIQHNLTLSNISSSLSVFWIGNDAERKIIWGTALTMSKVRPLFGLGLGTFMKNFEKYSLNGIPYYGVPYAHNCYLQMMAETGIIGLSVFLWLIGTVLIRSASNRNKIKDRFLFSFLLGLLGGLFAFLIHSAVDTNLYSLPLAVLFWFSLGLIVSIQKYYKTK